MKNGQELMTKTLFLTGWIILLFSCNQKVNNQPYNYGSQSDSAVYHFNKGWEQIMDYGQWTLSEESFRKAVEIDPDFLIGKSLVGKISRDLDERVRLLNEINAEKNDATEDDQLLLDITLTTLELMNARDQKIKLEPEFITHFRNLGENNYRKFIHKYPEESYMKAEYIEFLHSQHGAKQALDSLHLLTTTTQKKLPFFIGYAALLESEMGNHVKAITLANQLKENIDNPNIPSPYVLFAQIYSEMDSTMLAKSHIDRAVQLDSNHMIAQRVKKNIDNKLEEAIK